MVMIYRQLVIMMITLFSFLTTGQASELAVISDFKPNCIADILKPVSLTVKTPGYQQQVAFLESLEFKGALEQLREHATRQGADVILLTDVNNHVTKFVKESGIQPISRGRKPRTKETYLITHFEAQLLKVCRQDQSFSDERNLFSKEGYKLKASSFKYVSTLHLNDFQEPIEKAQLIKLPPANISFTTGVYDIKLGSSIAFTIEKLGPPSIVLMLDNQEEVLGYGRNLWFTYSSDRLKSVSSSLALLNSLGQNSIGFRDGFDNTPWQLEDVVAYKSPIEDVRSLFSGYDIKEHSRQLIITKKQQELILDFDDFHPTSKEHPVTLLTGFTLQYHQSQKKKKVLTQLTTMQEQWLYKHLQPNNVQLMTLTNLLKEIPQTNRINIANDDKQWWIVGNHALLRFEGQELIKAYLSESVFSDSRGSTLLQSVALMNLPQDKQGMLSRYKNAIDNYDEVDISGENFYLTAKFESEEDDANIYELVFTYL